MENLNANCGIWLFAIGIRLPAHGAEPGCRPQRVKERACGQCYEFSLACFQERPENLLILLQFHLQNASRTAWRADGPNIERSVRLIGCRNALSNVHRPKLLAEMGNLFPGKCALVLCCRGIGRHACPAPRARAPLLRRKWPLVSVLINAGMKLRRHHLRRTEGRTGAGGGGWRRWSVYRSEVFDARFASQFTHRHAVSGIGFGIAQSTSKFG